MKLKEFLNEKDNELSNTNYSKEELKSILKADRVKKLIGGKYEVWGNFYGNPNDIPIKIKVWHGTFDCSLHLFKKGATLTGCPEIVDEDFVCTENKLENLEGGPRIVKGDCLVDQSHLKSLKGSPRVVGGDFSCIGNKITSLEGGPEIVKETFYVMGNKLTSLKGAPKKVGGDFICYDNPKIFTEDEVRELTDVRLNVDTWVK